MGVPIGGRTGQLLCGGGAVMDEVILHLVVWGWNRSN